MASLPKKQPTWEERSHARWLMRSTWQQQMSTEGVLVSCLNCDQFDHKGELCSLAKARPPANVIPFGCPSWIEDIPF